MPSLRTILRSGNGQHARSLSLDDLGRQLELLQYQGVQYALGLPSLGTYRDEEVRSHGEDHAYTFSGAVQAAVGARIDLFSQVRFSWKRFGAAPRPMASDLFTDASLAPVDDPADLLAWIEADIAWAGNAFVVRDGDQLRRLVPWWVTIIVGSRSQPDRPETAWDAEPIGYVYAPPGEDPEPFLASEVAHRYDRPDPAARFRGASYLRAALQSVTNTEAQSRYIANFYRNGAVPGTWLKFPAEQTIAQVREFKDLFEEGHAGVENAFRTAYLGGGADPVILGAKLADLSAKEITANEYANICNVCRVPVVIVGIIPGLENAATYANFGPALRSFADITIRPAWLRTVNALAKLLPAPRGASLWYDTAGISALQEDAKDDAAVMQTNAVTVRNLIDAGYEPDAVLEAVRTGDFGKLLGQHSGLFSVQLQAPGGGEGGGPTDAERALNAATTLQRLALPANSGKPLLSADEAREVANVVMGAPALTGPAPEPTPVLPAPFELGPPDDDAEEEAA